MVAKLDAEKQPGNSNGTTETHTSMSIIPMTESSYLEIRRVPLQLLANLGVDRSRAMHDAIPWEQTMFMGKKRPRQECFYSSLALCASDAYTTKNKGVTVRPMKQLPEAIIPLVKFAEETCDATYNQAILNKYKDETDEERCTTSIGEHADDEKEIDQTVPVVSISFGAPRRFRVRVKKTRKFRDVLLEEGDMCIMRGKFQEECTHELPKVSKREAEQYPERKGLRISLTLRCLHN